MIKQNEQEIRYIDKTPDIKSETFVNDDYRGATVTNISRFLETKNKNELGKRARERLAVLK